MTVLATLNKDFNGEIPKIYDSSLTCFDPLSYTYDNKGRVAKEENSDGSSVSYEYDAWGKITAVGSTHSYESYDKELANINPLRYRGYYLDSETGYYYLQSRYYDASICRFINADMYIIVNSAKNDNYTGLNLFAYCGNNAVNNADYNGQAYNPSKAKSYAEKWWNSTNSAYGRNSNGDCANFVSQCLYAGGISKMTGMFKWGWHCYKNNNVNVNGQPAVTYDRSHAWSGAQNLHDWLSQNNYISATYTIKKASDVNTVGKKLYNKAYCSAAIFFDWNNSKNPKGINHATISGQIVNYNNLYDIYFYAHSNDRNGKRYNSKGKRQYTSIKDFYNQKDYKNMIVYVCILK